MAFAGIASGREPSGAWSVAVEYNANNGRVSAVVVTNGTDQVIAARVVLDGDPTVYGQDYPPGLTTTPIPGNRVQVVPDVEGGVRLAGLASCRIGVP